MLRAGEKVECKDAHGHDAALKSVKKTSLSSLFRMSPRKAGLVSEAQSAQALLQDVTGTSTDDFHLVMEDLAHITDNDDRQDDVEESQTKMEATNKETRLWKQRVADLQEELQLLKEQLSQHFIDLADSDMIIMPRAEFEELEELHTRELSRLQNEYAHELAELRRKVSDAQDELRVSHDQIVLFMTHVADSQERILALQEELKQAGLKQLESQCELTKLQREKVELAESTASANKQRVDLQGRLVILQHDHDLLRLRCEALERRSPCLSGPGPRYQSVPDVGEMADALVNSVSVDIDERVMPMSDVSLDDD